jgi:peptidoglycan/LPS O-acetylase OafA/YrhL
MFKPSLFEWRDRLSDSVQSELIRRHKAVSATIIGLLVGTVLLCIIAYLGKGYFRQDPNPTLYTALRITILILGLGAVTLRRTRFSTMRLQDIAGLKGASGLLDTLEKTTLEVALIGAAIAVLGFAATVMTGNDFYSYWAGVVAVAVLAYSYPTKSSWQRTLRQFLINPADNSKNNS